MSALKPRRGRRPDVDAYVRAVVEHAPPLTADQVAGLAALLPPTGRKAPAEQEAA